MHSGAVSLCLCGHKAGKVKLQWCWWWVLRVSRTLPLYADLQPKSRMSPVIGRNTWVPSCTTELCIMTFFFPADSMAVAALAYWWWTVSELSRSQWIWNQFTVFSVQEAEQEILHNITRYRDRWSSWKTIIWSVILQVESGKNIVRVDRFLFGNLSQNTSSRQGVVYN